MLLCCRHSAIDDDGDSESVGLFVTTMTMIAMVTMDDAKYVV